MNPALLIPIALSAADTHQCSYWLSRFQEIATYEQIMIQDVPKVAARDGSWSALDLERELFRRIAVIRERIDAEVEADR